MTFTVETQTIKKRVINGGASAPFIQAVVDPVSGQAKVQLKPTSLDKAHRMLVDSSADAAEWAAMFTALHQQMKDAETQAAMTSDERRAAVARALDEHETKSERSA